MLMSLTMRLLPTPPEDSRGVTSVVAIPTPSFNSGARLPLAGFSIAGNETFHYTARSRGCRGESPDGSGRGTCFGTGDVRKLKFRSLRFGRKELRHVAELIIS